jgi:hypothetical protein
MPVNTLLVRWIGGWTEVSEPSGGARREAVLGLGAQQSAAEAQRVAYAQLLTILDPRTEVAADIRPMAADDFPWIAYRVGDSVTVGDWNMAPADQRVISLGASVDDNGMVTYSAELHDRILGERERAEQSMKKMINGTLRGASKVATPTGLVGKRNTPPPPKGGS